MKFLSILAAMSLALAPAMASAGSGGTGESDSTGNAGQPISGPLAGRALEQPTIPTGVILLGGLVLVGGAVVAIIGASDSNNNTND